MSARPLHMQGVLWKRRDVFKNSWRPRWFVLHPDQRVLTYYLLSQNESGPQNLISTRTNAPSSANSVDNINRLVGSSTSNNNRRRTFSESSSLSTNTIDCDVVPRGTIYLFNPKNIESNDILTRPEEDLYAFSIIDNETGTHCHLATRTVEDRERWIFLIRRVCLDQLNHDERSSSHHSSPNINDLGTSASVERLSVERLEETKVSANLSQGSMIIGTDQQRADHCQAESVIYSKALPSLKKEILILVGPLILYKVLKIIISSRVAALCFITTSVLSSRWVALDILTSVMRVSCRKGKKGNENMESIGHGSTCCRFTVDITSALKFFDVENNGRTIENKISIAHVLVKSIATAMDKYSDLISRDYSILPYLLYSVDVAYIDLRSNTNCVCMNNADDMSFGDIANKFRSENDTTTTPSFWRKVIGHTCKVVIKPDLDLPNIDLNLNLTDCPIAMIISGTSCTQLEKEGGSQHRKLNISINVQSTDVISCQKFAEQVQKYIQSPDLMIKQQ